MNDYESRIGTVIESNYQLASESSERLRVKIIGFDNETKTYTLEIISTTPWCSSLGLTQGLVFANLHRKSYTGKTPHHGVVTFPEFWIPADGKLPWMNLQFDPNPTFEHYR